MEIFLLTSKESHEAALSGAFQVMLPSNNRLLFGIGAFVSHTLSPGQRRSRARQTEALIQESPSRSTAELWAALTKKLPEVGQNIAALGVINEDGSLDLKVSGLQSVLVKSEQKQKLITLQNSTAQISAEILSGATSLVFLEEKSAQAEEIAAFLQEAEQLLGTSAVRSLLSPRISEALPITPPEATPRVSTIPPPEGAPQPHTWQRYAPWGVAVVASGLWLFSVGGGSPTQHVTTPKSTIVDTKPKFIPQEDEPVAEVEKPKKPLTKTPDEEEPSSAPQSQSTAEPATKPTTQEPKTPPKNTKPPVKKPVTKKK